MGGDGGYCPRLIGILSGSRRVRLWIWWGISCPPIRQIWPSAFLKGNGDVETIDKRIVLGIIAIQVDDLLISGGSDFTDYISWEIKENPMWVAIWETDRSIRMWELGKRSIRIADA